jgi:hypothetical protein
MGATLIYAGNSQLASRHCKIYHEKSANGDGSRDIYVQQQAVQSRGGWFGGDGSDDEDGCGDW